MSTAIAAITTSVVHLPRAAAKRVRQPARAWKIGQDQGIPYTVRERALRIVPKAPEPAPTQAREPTPAEIHSVLIACLITGLTDRAKLALHARMQKMYDRAAAVGNVERQTMVKAAADCMYFTIETGA